MSDITQILVSIDTEEDNWEPARDGNTVENIRELPQLDRLFERLGVRATYFATYMVASTGWSAEILRGLATSGRAEVGAHLHPWNTPPLLSPMTRRNTMLTNLPVDEQVAKLRTLTGVLRSALGERPWAFRAGRWGFDGSTASALIECGYRVDSSVTPGRSWYEDDGPSHVGAPLGVYRLDNKGDHRIPSPHGTLVEVPLSWGYRHQWWNAAEVLHRVIDRPGFARTHLLVLGERLHLVNLAVMSPEIADVDDMVLLAKKLLDRGVQHLHVSFHSPSLRPGLSPFVQSQADVDRLYGRIESLIEQLAALTRVEFATVSEGADRLVPHRSAPQGVLIPVISPERKLVVLSYHFPPDGAIGGLRWAGLTKYLAAHGWQSWVITGAPDTGVPIDRVEVMSRPRWPILNDVYRAFRMSRVAKGAATQASRRSNAPRLPRSTPPGARAVVTSRRSFPARLRYELAVLLGLPDEARGWLLRAAWTARRLLWRERPPIIVSSGPPHSAHFAAWLATRLSRVTWIVDMRDPWAGPFSDAWSATPFLQSVFARRMFLWLERLVVRDATLVVCNTREFASTLAARYPGARIEYVPNAVDRALLPEITDAPFDGLGIVHVGTIYGGRDLGPVLVALQAFLARHPGARTDGTRLRIAGSVEDPYATVLRGQISDLGLTGVVESFGMLSRANALQLVGRSRLAIVLAQQQELQVPAKLYEMVAMGVPTVVIAELDSATASEARRLGADIVVPEDVESLALLIEQRWSATDVQPAPVSGEVDYQQMARRVSAMFATPVARIRPTQKG